MTRAGTRSPARANHDTKDIKAFTAPGGVQPTRVRERTVASQHAAGSVDFHHNNEESLPTPMAFAPPTGSPECEGFVGEEKHVTKAPVNTSSGTTQ